MTQPISLTIFQIQTEKFSWTICEKSDALTNCVRSQMQFYTFL